MRLLALWMLIAAGQETVPPHPAPAQFVTGGQALLFRTPPGATECPFVRSWTPQGHGVILFLVPPRSCTVGANERSFRPADVPRISVAYVRDALSAGGEGAPARPCAGMGTATLFGKPTRLCRGSDGAMTTVSASVRYEGDSEDELAVKLVTSPARLRRDLATLRAMLASFTTCTETLHFLDIGGPGGPRSEEQIGRGPPCPGDAEPF